MKLKKSSRHAKITGDFCENIIRYWLSKYGFECAIIDHTGIDIIARRLRSKEVIGISVKGRSRNVGKEGTPLSIDNDNFRKIKKACKAFKCKPYFALVIDAGEKIYCYILSLKHLLALQRKGKNTYSWHMKDKDIERYAKDRKIISFEFIYRTINWWE
ncbi:MAG: hypothetical protein NTW66_01785 [Candidatus Magasanikbacteria bacterium]|nr:hypothetical protein [Candidatus Magasanikbacteria bacterium]